MDEPQPGAKRAAVSAAVPKTLVAPHGLEQILATFGDIYAYIDRNGALDPRWWADVLTGVRLPFALRLSWDHSKNVASVTCHKLLAENLSVVFGDIEKRGLRPKVTSLGGCFAFRRQRTGARLSTHSWGIAIDLNAETNRQGSCGDMDPEVIAVFRDAGFKWGGDWPSKAEKISNRSRGMKQLTAGAEAPVFSSTYGTTEVVPFPTTYGTTRRRSLPEPV
jgi:D-alanyl-D-alanine carboxypeptidase